MKPADLQKLGLGQFPLVIGGIVPVVNIDGVQPGPMRFTGPVLADIYLGKIKTWNDPAITKLNPDLKLPMPPSLSCIVPMGLGRPSIGRTISPRSAPSGKTRWAKARRSNGQSASAARAMKVWPRSSTRPRTQSATLNMLTCFKTRWLGASQNKAGKFIKPDAASFQAAAASAKWGDAQDFYLIMTDASDEDAYPIAATVFILMYKQPKDSARTNAAMDFFKWALENGQPEATSLDYVPFPPNVVQQIENYWKAQFAGLKG